MGMIEAFTGQLGCRCTSSTVLELIACTVKAYAHVVNWGCEDICCCCLNSVGARAGWCCPDLIFYREYDDGDDWLVTLWLH